MRRGIAATALVAALGVTLAACGGSDSGSNGGSKGSGELSGTVTWWDTSTVGSEDKVFKKLAEDFTKKHPKVTVKYVNVPFGEAQNKFKNAAQSGSGAPDVIRSEVAWTPEFADLTTSRFRSSPRTPATTTYARSTNCWAPAVPDSQNPVSSSATNATTTSPSVARNDMITPEATQ
ncbi:extracellular solute-binding protein, partial [Streptomyces roseolus]|uniref:extracellular solute-binding protein n=1 Tax=Streptomyces roseolus TaxID=67358 RepID=UPI003664E07D